LAADNGLAQSWTELASGTTENLHAIDASFSDCWVVGDNGFVATGAGCSTFASADIGAGTADLTSVDRTTSVEIWIGGADGLVRQRTVGNTWLVRTIAAAATAGESVTVFTRSSGQSWAVGDQGSVYRFPDAFTGWELSTTAGSALNGGDGAVGSIATTVGNDGLILRTTDGGTSWSTLTSGTTADLHAYIPGPGGSQLIVGDGGTILKSTDNGVTWQVKTSHTQDALYDIATSFQNSNWVMAVGDNGVVLRSTDGGETWCHLHVTTKKLRGLEFLSNSTAVVVGDGGLIMRTDDGGGDCQAQQLVIFADDLEGGPPPVWSATYP
jgi:photosystem II stability/assembly factor-like uncharacterized protein